MIHWAESGLTEMQLNQKKSGEDDNESDLA